MSRRGILITAGAVLALVALVAGAIYLVFAPEEVVFEAAFSPILLFIAGVYCFVPFFWKEQGWWQRHWANRWGRACIIAVIICTEALGARVIASIISMLFTFPLGWPVPLSWQGLLTVLFFRVVPGAAVVLWLISWFITRRARQRMPSMPAGYGWQPVPLPEPLPPASFPEPLPQSEQVWC